MKGFFLVFAISLVTIQINAQSLNLEWAQGFGGPASNENSNSVAVDSRGNVYTTGWFTGTSDFDPSADTFLMTTYGDVDVFISKFDAYGNFVWAKQIGGKKEDRSFSLALDANDNVYIIGNTTDTVDFDPGKNLFLVKNNYPTNGFILKLDAFGNFKWVKNCGSTNENIHIDEVGNIFVTGAFGKGCDFDPGPKLYIMDANESGGDMFILKLNSNGDFLWAKSIGGEYWQMGASIKTDNKGNVIAMGVNNNYITIAKLSSSGILIWNKTIKASHNTPKDMCIDRAGSVYVTGYFDGNTDFDPGPGNYILNSSGYNDFYVAKLDSSGNFKWAYVTGGKDNYDMAFSIISDKIGHIYISGFFYGTIDFDSGPGIFELNSNNKYGIFILKMDTSGNFVWAKNIGGNVSSPNIAAFITNDSKKNIYCTGYFSGNGIIRSDKQSKLLPSIGGTDMFVSKFSQDSCSNLVLIIDALNNKTCVDSIAHVSVITKAGTRPYLYKWDNANATFDSVCHFKSKGIYNLTVSDSNNCSRSTSFLIYGPASYSGYDLNSTLLLSPFRPGRLANVQCFAFNERCEVKTGKLSITLDSMVDYTYSIPPPDEVKKDTLIWNFSGLSYDSKPISPVIYLRTKEHALQSDTVCFETILTPKIGDENKFNNNKRYCYPVKNSFDPNIISVYPPGECEANYVLKDKPLTYTVQFQNTGNAEAIDVYILDTLDINLDLTRLRVIGKSHEPLIVEVLNDRVIKFSFNGINLPDSNYNEKASHGYVIYEVMPNNLLQDQTIINAKVGIYFDFNKPVFTNTLKNTLAYYMPLCKPIQQPDNQNKNFVIIYPNPNNGSFTLEIPNPQSDLSAELFNLIGQKIYNIATNSNQTSYSVNLNIPNGIYLLKVRNGGIFYKKKVSIFN